MGLIALMGGTSYSRQQDRTPKPQVQALLNQATEQIKGRKFEDAIAVAKKAVPLAQSLSDTAGQAQALRLLGYAYQETDDLQTALDSFSQSRVLFGKVKDDQNELDVVLASAGLEYGFGRVDKAVLLYDDALTLHLRTADKRGQAETTLTIATMLETRDPERSLKAGKDAVGLFESLKDDQWQIVAMIVVGNALSRLGEDQQTVETLTKAANHARSAGLTGLEGEVLAQLAEKYENLNQIPAALDFYDRSLEIARASKDKNREGKRLTNLGIVANKIGSRRIAQDYFTKAIAALASDDDEADRATAMQNLGSSLHADGKDEDAKKWLNEAMALHRKRGNVVGEAGCLGTLGTIAREEAEFDDATEKLTSAADIYAKFGDRESQATAIDGLGSVLYEQGKFLEAVGQYDKAIKLYDDVKSSSFAATSYGNKGQALYRAGKLTEAESSYREAIARYEFVRSGMGGLSDAKSDYLKQRVHVYQQLANVLTRLGEPNEAFDVAQKTKARGLLDLLASGRLVAEAGTTPEEQRTERDLRQKAETLNARMLREGVENEVGAKARYQKLSEELKKVEGDLSTFMTRLYSRYPGLASKRIADTAKTTEVGMALPEDTALVEFVVGRYAVVTLVLRKIDGVLTVTGHSRTIPLQELADKCLALRRACSDPDGDYADIAQDLYKDLIGPVMADIVGKKRLILCPDACLWDVPFAALMSDSKQFLVNDFELDYAYSATGAYAALTSTAGGSKATKDLLVCANPDFGPVERFKSLVEAGQRPIDTPSRPIDQPSRPIDQPSRPIDQPSRAIDSVSRAIDSVSRAIDSLSREASEGSGVSGAIKPLPGTQKEADGLAALMPGAAIFTGKEAQETKIKKELKDYRYIHFATHGFVNDASPLLSNIVLAQPTAGSKDDGFLTARELHGLSLDADLAVLSACNTARGEVRSGEGMVGLTWALFVAGCRSQVVSQWAVDDASTSELMVDFYTKLKASGGVRGRSLREASLGLRANAKYAHPYYWASFVLVGEWR